MADPKVPQAVPEPRFTNIARVTHNATEFYLEFGQMLPAQPGAAGLIAALVMTPQHAKLLVVALSDNVSRYEAQHGEIKLPAVPSGLVQ